MLEYQGQYGKAKVMIDTIDEMTVSQIYGFLNHPAFTLPIAIMPDTHAGAGAVIGFTMELTDKVIPNVIGVDIGCGMLSMNYGPDLELDREELDKSIRAKIPFGTNVRTESVFNIEKFSLETNRALSMFNREYVKRYGGTYTVPKVNEKWFEKKSEDIGIDVGRVFKSIGTLGGGNHFIEVDLDDQTGNYWVTVHSGSRQFGQKIALYHQRLAKKYNENEEGKKPGGSELAYLEHKMMYDYLCDMVVAQKYAQENREVMAHLIYKIINKGIYNVIESVHNYIDFNDFIIRKGAISSYEGQKMIIPFNMEDGILICEGKSNPEWNFSAPHGSGRAGSRKWAKANISNDEAKERMESKDIYFSKLPTDETRDAYKNSSIIENSIEPTATIVAKLRPVLNMKD